MSLDTPIATRLHTDAERFEFYAQQPNANGCRIWMGAVGDNGYGYSAGDNGGRLAHRMSYELHNEVVLSRGQAIHHTCATKRCVEPKHLQCITPEENTAEMVERNEYIRRIAELEALLAAR